MSKLVVVSPIPLFEGQTYTLTPSNNWSTVPTSSPVKVTGAFQNDSVDNHFHRDHRKGETYDRGSNWTARKCSVEKDPVFVDVQCHFGLWFGYRGPVLVHDSNHFTHSHFVAMADNWASSELDLYGLGSTAIAKVLPTNPISDVPTAVAELLGEGLPLPGRSLLTGRQGKLSSSAGEYLNYQWGVLPLLSEIQEFGKAARRAEELIDRYARNSGKIIRRKYEFPVVQEDSIINLGSSPLTQSGQWFGGIGQQYIRDFLTPGYGGFPGVRTDTHSKSKKTWFKGAFTYYLPKVGSGLSDKLAREEALMRHLYGGISVNTAWELLPYSWAVDWVTNAGDIIHNVNAFAQDGLVMPWGYIMEKVELRESRMVEGARFGRMGNPGDGQFLFSGPVTDTFSATFMRRRKATPFGFGLTYDGLNNRQKSILAALGIQRIL